jgi:hypothetical protein
MMTTSFVLRYKLRFRKMFKCRDAKFDRQINATHFAAELYVHKLRVQSAEDSKMNLER